MYSVVSRNCRNRFFSEWPFILWVTFLEIYGPAGLWPTCFSLDNILHLCHYNSHRHIKSTKHYPMFRVNVRSWESSKRYVFKQLRLNMTNQFWIARPLQTLHIVSNSKYGDLFCHQLTRWLSYGWSTFRWLCEWLCFFPWWTTSAKPITATS